MATRKRHDPPTRPTQLDGGDYTDDQFLNLRTDEFHYVCANPNDISGGVAATHRYEARGYEPVFATEGGERPATGRVVIGQPVTQLGQVLMRCPIELHAERAARGLRAAEEFDRRTKKVAGLDDSNFGGRRAYIGALPGDLTEQEA